MVTDPALHARGHRGWTHRWRLGASGCPCHDKRVIGALVAASLFVPSTGEPEDQWNIVYGFLLGMIPGALFGNVVNNWLATEHGRHAVSPRSRTVIKALTIIAAAGVAVFLGEWWDVTDLIN